MAMDNSQLPGGGLPPVSGIGPFKVRFEADTAALQSGVDTAISGIRDELTSLKSGFMDFETSLGSSLSMTIGRLRGELASMVSELRNAAQEFRTMGYSGGGSPGGSTSSSFYIPPVGGQGFSGSTGSASNAGSTGNTGSVWGSSGGSTSSSFYIPPVGGRGFSGSTGNAGNAGSAGNTGNVGGSPGGSTAGPTVGPPPPPHSTGYTPTPGTYAQQLQQFRFDQINPGSGVFLHEMGTASQIQNIDRQNKHLYESTSGSLQQHLAQVQAGGKTTYLESAIQQEIATLQQTSSAFSSEFAKKYGSSTPTGKTIQSILNDPAAMDSLFGQSLRPSDIQAEVLKRSPELANNPGLLQEEILAERQTRQRTISQTNQNMIQAQYLLESGATSSSMATAAQETLKTAPNATQATASSSRMRRTLGEAAIVYLAGEALGSAGGVLGGPYAQFGSGSFYGNAWQTAMPYDLSTGAMGLNAGVNPNTAISTYQALGHQQHLSSLEISKTAAIESNFAGVRGAAFLFKDSADTYQFATFMGISGSLAGQVAGQAIGGGSTQAPGALFSSIQHAGQMTGLSNTAVASLVSTMQQALVSSYQSTTNAPGYAGGLLGMFKSGFGMSPSEAQQAAGSVTSMIGNGPHYNMMSGQLMMQAYQQTHAGPINIAHLLNAAQSGPTEAEFKQQLLDLQTFAEHNSQLSTQMMAQGILGPNAFGRQFNQIYSKLHTGSITSGDINTWFHQANGKSPGGTSPAKPPTGEYQNVLHETAKVQNAQLSIGNATISVSHTAGPVVGATAGIGASLLKDAGIGLAVAGASALPSLFSKIKGWFGGGGSGSSGPLGGGGGGLGGCSSCEQGTQAATQQVAQSTSQIVEMLGMGALGLGGVGAMLLGKNGKFVPNMLSPTGQMAAMGQETTTTLNGMTTTLNNLNATLSKLEGGSSVTSPGGNYLTGLTSVKGGNISAFAKSMSPYAAQVSKATGLPESLLLAQWSLESGNGTSVAAKLDNNLGGMKPWGPYGAGKDSKYAGFSSLQQFAQADAAFYNNNSNYSQLLSQARSGSPMGTLLADLQNSGYAGNPNYGQTLASMLATGAYGSYTPGTISPGASTVASTPVQIQLGQQLLASLSGQAKAPKTGHPDTPSTNAGLSLAALLAKFLSGQALSSSPGTAIGAGATALGLSALLSGLGSTGLLGLLGVL